MIFKGSFPDELLIPFLISLRFPGAQSNGGFFFVSKGNGFTSA